MNSTILFLTIIILNVLDAVTTHIGIANGGQELNPIMNWFIQNFGTPGIVGFKFIVLSFLGVMINRNFVSDNTLKVMIFLFSVVVLNNVYVIVFK